MSRLPGIHTEYSRQRRNRSRWPWIMLLMIFWNGLAAQEIMINAEEVPLNQLMMQVALDHGIQVSYDDQLLSGFPVTLHMHFSSPDEAVSALLEGLPLDYELKGEVYVIFSKKDPPVVREYILSGRIMDSRSGEPLPFSHLLVNQRGIISDADGNFFFTQKQDSIFGLRVSYLGYYIRDTVLEAGTHHLIGLTPSIIGLQEVVIEGFAIERSGQAGEEPGVLRLNHKIAYRLPGNGDNAVFNFLRLQPGILAAGEQSSEMMIWGSYSGHSQVQFDGFTLFGLKNFNDNISFVNPYMVKDIRVLKGGYPAGYGDRVGGIVEISGIIGDTSKPSINLNINNMTVNGMASIPVTKSASMIFAYRHTYYDLLDGEDLSLSIRNRRIPQQADINVYPDYRFRDMNLKYAGTGRSGDTYYISLYEGNDRFSYNVEQVRIQTEVTQETEEENRQQGGTLYYNKSWKRGFSSRFLVSVSQLKRDLTEKQEVIRELDGLSLFSRNLYYNNRILETHVKHSDHIPLSERHQLELGIGYVYDDIYFRQDTSGTSYYQSIAAAHRMNLHLQDEISVFPHVTVTPGLRTEVTMNPGKVYLAPRIRAIIDLTERWRLNGAWGIYHQFISETSIIDELGNYRYFWAICDNQEVPVLRARHLVGGITYNNEGLTVSLEMFHKTTKGITRYVNLMRQGIQAVFQGDARVNGMDLLVKHYFRKHEAWVSYTLSKTEEYFPYFPTEDYSTAPQDQRHEVKGAVLLNFKPFFLTVNYVYGSGFTSRAAFFNNDEERYPYSRLDAAFIYSHSIKRYHFEAGISLLNVLNRENIKYANLIRIPDWQTNSISIHAEAVPFTPTLYLNLAF